MDIHCAPSAHHVFVKMHHLRTMRMPCTHHMWRTGPLDRWDRHLAPLCLSLPSSDRCWSHPLPPGHWLAHCTALHFRLLAEWSHLGRLALLRPRPLHPAAWLGEMRCTRPRAPVNTWCLARYSGNYTLSKATDAYSEQTKGAKNGPY